MNTTQSLRTNSAGLGFRGGAAKIDAKSVYIICLVQLVYVRVVYFNNFHL